MLNPSDRVNVDDCKKILSFITKGYKVPKIIYETIFKVCLMEIEEKNKVVLIKRDPNINRDRVSGVYVKIVHGETLEIHPATVGGYGADFDGDSAYSAIIVYKNNKNYNIHIKDFHKYFKCEKYEEKIKDNGIKIHKYKVLDDVYAEAIDLKTGDIIQKKITEWSIHENIEMYKLYRRPRISQCSNFRPFWISSDHSMIAYNLETKQIERVSPKEILEDITIKEQLNPTKKIKCKSKYFLLKEINLKYSNNSYKDYLVNENFRNSTASESDIGYMISAYIGDGYISYSGDKHIYNLFALTNSNDIISDKWCSILETVTKNKIVGKKDTHTGYKDDKGIIKLNGDRAANALRSYVCDINLCNIIVENFGKGSGTKHLPYWINNINSDFIYGLCAGYLDTDGTINDKYICITSKSEELMYAFSNLLRVKFNVDSSVFKECRKSFIDKVVMLNENGEQYEVTKEIQTKDESKWRYYYKLNIIMNSVSKDFISNVVNIMAHPDKKQKIQSVLDTIKSDARSSTVSFVPYELIEKMSITDRKKYFGLTNDNTIKIKQSGFTQGSINIPEDIINNSSLNDATKELLRKQNNNEIEFIPCEYIDLELDESMTTGYDLTVDDYCTFTTDDGIFVWDTMAIYAVLSNEAQNEIKKKMITATTNESLHSPKFEITKEALTGLLTITYMEDGNQKPVTVNNVTDSEKLYIGDKVRYSGIETTAGRVIFNSCLPSYIPFINKPMTGKDIKKLLSQLIERSEKDYVKTTDNFTKVGFHYATIYPMSISLDMLELTPEFYKLKDALANEKDLNKQIVILDTMEKAMIEYLKKNVPQLYLQIVSGAAKGAGQLRQILISKGLITDPAGNLLPVIARGMHEGYSPEEYFNASAGSRRGIIGRALNTAYGGYAYRKAIFCLGNCECNIEDADCGTKKGLDLKITNDLFKRLSGRYVIDSNGKTSPLTKDHIGHVVKLRSPVYCKSNKICRTCYGDLIYQTKSKHAGIIAAGNTLSLSEKIMKCSTGLVYIKNYGFISLEDYWNIDNQ